jgi:dolichol-phosphate mannosyltransferase
MSTIPAISVILPTRNERDNVVPLIECIHQEIRDYSHEIVVVDDESTDGTCGALLSLNDARLKVFLRREEHSLAGAIRHGIEHSMGEILIVMDSDFDHNPRFLPSLIRPLHDNFDCVSASRFLKPCFGDGHPRKTASRIFNVFIRRMTGIKLTDSLYGFFAVKRGILEQCPYDSIFFGHGDYGMRLYYYLQKNKARILELPALPGKRRSGRGNRHLVRTFYRYFVAVAQLAGTVRPK